MNQTGHESPCCAVLLDTGGFQRPTFSPIRPVPTLKTRFDQSQTRIIFFSTNQLRHRTRGHLAGYLNTTESQVSLSRARPIRRRHHSSRPRPSGRGWMGHLDREGGVSRKCGCHAPERMRVFPTNHRVKQHEPTTGEFVARAKGVLAVQRLEDQL